MSSRLLVNLIDPSEIVVPDTDGVPDAGAPDTGALSIGKWLDEAFNNNTALFIAIGLTVLVVAVIIVLLIRRRKKQNLIKGFGGYAPMKLGTQKYLVPKLAGLSFIILVSVFGILKFNDNQRMASAEAVDGPSLTVTTEDITAIDIEMEDEAVFGVGESKVKVTTATDTGYTLMAYVDSTSADLTNDSNDVITMLETSQSQALTDNTWGISLSKPNSQEETLFRGLPTAEKDAMVVKVAGRATETNDETTLYYGAYITPDLDYGTYEGVTINYIAIPHVITNDDVTVRYHGNGFYFDEAKTKDTNTVVYGDICKMEYIGVGGGCTTIYVDEENAKISKTPLIDDEGAAEYEFGYYSDSVYADSVSFEGADLLKVELNYGVEDWYDFLYVFEGAHDESEGDYWFVNEDKLTIINDGQYDNGMATFYVDSDAITFVLTSDYSGAYYGYYATVMPVYYEQPSGTETVEDKLCQFVKSNNVDDDGEIIESYSSDYYSLQAISIPGASKVKVEVEYAITASSAWIGVIEGVFAGDWDDKPRDFVSYEIYSEENNISGTDEYIINGSIVTFEMELWNEPVEGYDYGFYAKLYPIYDEEHEGTTTTQICSYGVKEGEYLLPLANNWYEEWYYEYENEETNENIWESFEFTDEIVDYVYGNPEFFPGNIIDVYAYDTYYRIVYDGNGGVAGEEEDVGGFWIYNDDSKSIWDNWFENAGYEFVGWNTKPDGSGDWYYPGNIIYSEGHLGETLTLYAQWEFGGYSGVINYYPNASGVLDSMGEQYYTGFDTSVVLWASNFIRSGYGFAGWSDKSDWVLGENDANGNGTGSNVGYYIYGPNQTIDSARLSSGQLNLYAVWVPSAGSLQNWTCPDNNNMPVGSVTALTDLRDNDTYAVAKLADGRCWTIENLRLDYDANFNSSLSQGFGGLFSGLANPETTFGSGPNSLYKGDDSGDIAGVNGATMTDIGSDWMYCGMPRYNNNNTNADGVVNSNTNVTYMTGANQNVYSYGNYYTWPAARADTNRYISKTTNTSICPAGWRLPKGDWGSSYYSESDYWQLVVMNLNDGVTPVNYSTGYAPYYSGLSEAGPVDAKIRSFPNNFVQSGYFDSNMIRDRGVSGDYWSHNEDVINSAYSLIFNNSSVKPGSDTNFKNEGAAIRCVLSPGA